jgi:hypothetical protein
VVGLGLGLVVGLVCSPSIVEVRREADLPAGEGELAGAVGGLDGEEEPLADDEGAGGLEARGRHEGQPMCLIISVPNSEHLTSRAPSMRRAKS